MQIQHSVELHMQLMIYFPFLIQQQEFMYVYTRARQVPTLVDFIQPALWVHSSRDDNPA